MTTHRFPRLGAAATALALSVAVTAGVVGCGVHRAPAGPYPHPAFKLMPDGKRWLTENLDIDVPASSCYGNDRRACHRYGRLYTWTAAQVACQIVGGDWRLPTENEWRLLAKRYGGVYGESTDSGKTAFRALIAGGNSGFNALLGGGGDAEGHEYSRLEAHGFYWTASESGSMGATFMNFGRGSEGLYRQPNGEKQRRFSVRCVQDAR